MSEVLDELRLDHVNLAKLLDVLERQLAIFDAGGRPDYDIVTGVIDYCLTYPDRYHHPKEDLVVEKLRTRDPAVFEKLRMLADEHGKLAALTQRFHDVTEQVLNDVELPRNTFSDTARTFIDTYRQHMTWEDEALFEPAEHSLRAEDWQDIMRQIADVADPLFGARVSDEFEALRADIVNMDRGLR